MTAYRRWLVNGSDNLSITDLPPSVEVSQTKKRFTVQWMEDCSLVLRDTTLQDTSRWSSQPEDWFWLESMAELYFPAPVFGLRSSQWYEFRTS
ncbi:hypothetical protein YC2023_102090 [Brassica napus]